MKGKYASQEEEKWNDILYLPLSFSLSLSPFLSLSLSLSPISFLNTNYMHIWYALAYYM